jgi:microcin C transport system substrate-binding protein
MKPSPHLFFTVAVSALALTVAGCSKAQKEAARDISVEAQAYYKAHPDFFVNATAADLPADLKWENGADVPEFADPQAKRGGTLHFWIDDFPRTLRLVGPDANGSFRSFIFDDVGMALLGNVTLQVQPNTGQYYPGLAKEWALGADGRTMYFKLDPDARYSDGVPVRVGDFFFAFFFFRSTYINDPWSNGYYNSNFTKITKYDDTTFSMTWKEAKPDIYDRLGSCYPVPEHFYKELGPDFADRYQWRMEPTTGAYTVRPEDIHKGSSIDITRVQNWWANDKRFYRYRYNFDRIHFDVIRDSVKAIEAFKRGDLDVVGLTLPDNWYNKLPDTDASVQQGYVHKATFFNEIPVPNYGLYINQTMPLLDNQDIRTGIAYAANFDLVDQTYFRGDYVRLQSSADGYLQVPFPDIHPRPFSTEKALEAFAKAGFTNRGPDGILVNQKGQRLSFTVTTGYDRFRDVLTILKQEAAKAGLELNVEVLDGTTAFKKVQEKQHQIAFSAFAVTPEKYPRYWDFYHSANKKPQTNNLTMTADPAMDKLIDQYDRSTSMDEIRGLATQMEKKIYDNAAFIPAFKVPFYRFGYWRWIRWPQGFGVRLSDNPLSFGLEWMDEDLKKETLAARSAAKSFPASIEIYDQWKSKSEASSPASR